jgi:hypothetical protein
VKVGASAMEDIREQLGSGTWNRWGSGANVRRRIVVAEDDREMRRVIAATLIRDGFIVEEASDGPKLLHRD